MKYFLFFISLTFAILISCSNQSFSTQVNDEIINPIISDEAKSYWYNGQAEISSYNLKQSRYGEIREGTAVLIFVTEDFSTEEMTKANKTNKKTIPVLKLNHARNFTTGIYPYSILTSSFIPFEQYGHAIKVSTSVQEWCGHVYMELIQKKGYEYAVKSYFENENNVSGKLDFGFTEDEIWGTIRLYPQVLSETEAQVIPPLSYLRLLHLEIKSYACEISTEKINDTTTTVQLFYPELERTMKITYESNFPYSITGWTETYKDGFGDQAKLMTSTAEIIKVIRSDYWTKNKNNDQYLRKELGLDK